MKIQNFKFLKSVVMIFLLFLFAFFYFALENNSGMFFAIVFF